MNWHVHLFRIDCIYNYLESFFRQNNDGSKINFRIKMVKVTKLIKNLAFN
jgi:hypothetical protein